MKKKTVGDVVAKRTIETIQGARVELPDSERLTHLQFRRFAGCPMCNLHIHSFVRRHDEIKARGIQEVVVFYSSKEDLIKRHAQAPFALIADPRKTLYREFGVESSPVALLHPHSWLPAIQGLLAYFVALPARGESLIGLPADFLIDKTGRILACKYGIHAYDQWSVDELLALV